MHLIPLAEPEQAIGSNEPFVSHPSSHSAAKMADMCLAESARRAQPA